jgi:hypothetical protein
MNVSRGPKLYTIGAGAGSGGGGGTGAKTKRENKKYYRLRG